MTKPDTTTDQTKPKGVADLMEITGLSRNSVVAGIKAGELPGYKVGSVYRVPAEAFERFRRGEWQPHPRRLFPEGVHALPTKDDMLKKRGA